MKQTIPVRADADPNYTWALEDIYPSDDAWDAAYAEAQNFSRQISAFRGRLGSSARTLLEFLQLGETISVAFDSLYGYAQRRSDEGTAQKEFSAAIFFRRFLSGHGRQGPGLDSLRVELRLGVQQRVQFLVCWDPFLSHSKHPSPSRSFSASPVPASGGSAAWRDSAL